MNFRTLSFCLLAAAWSCQPAQKPQEKLTVPNDGTRIVKQFFENGKLKAEISVKDSLRHGICKNYNLSGILISEVNYANGKREGVAKNYYASGKIQMVIPYKNDKKSGESIWYFENGKTYRITPHENGKEHGIQKVFYEDGILQAEIPFRVGFICEGTKEYKTDGTLKKTPSIIIEEIDQLAMKGDFYIRLSLSNGAKTVKFYESVSGSHCREKTELTIPTQNGKGLLRVHVPRGSAVMRKITFLAEYKTQLANTMIICKEYNLAVKSR